MNLSEVLQQPLLDMAEVIGIASPTADLNTSWFGNPLASIESILTDSGQRAALFDLLDQVLPPQPVQGASTDAKWHPLLGAQTAGNLYLTVEESETPAIIGLGAQFGTGIATLLAEVPVLALNGSSLSVMSGTANGPIRLKLTVALNWTQPAHAIALAGIGMTLVYAPAASAANIEVVLQGQCCCTDLKLVLLAGWCRRRIPLRI